MTERDTIRAALHHIPAHDRDLWLRIGMAIKSELGDEGFDLWNEWGQADDSYNERDAHDVWKSIKANGRVTIGTLYHEAKANGWRDDGTYRKPTPEELTERQRAAAKREAREQVKLDREQARAASWAATLCEAGTEAKADNPYLTLKGVSPVSTLLEIEVGKAEEILGYRPKAGGVPLTGRLLLVPIHRDGELTSCELIDGEGRKTALAGKGTKTGGSWCTGSLPEGDGERLTFLEAEGVATSLTGKAATGAVAIAALTNANLKAVARAMCKRYPRGKHIILADLVKSSGKPDPHAIEAARAVGGLLAVPDFGANRPEGATDFNDLHQHRGLEAVERAITNAQAPGLSRSEVDTNDSTANAVNRAHDISTIEAAIAKLAADVGSVFEADVVAALKAERERNPAEYQRYRKRVKDAGASVGELDRLVCANGGGAAQCSGQGQPLDISDPEPWPERVDGAELLDGLAEIYRRYLVLPAHAATALALWTVHSYAYDYRSCTPCLGVSSPQKRCGKTRLLSIVAMLTLRALPASNITPSAVFRTVDIAHPTLIIDEADTFLRDNEELRGVINSGHTRDLAYVIRLVGEDHEPRKFSTWCPKVIAMIGKLPGTILDRSIVIKMSRRKKTEVIADLAEFTDAEQIRRRCIRWSEDNKVTIGNAKPKVPSELHDRAADNWQSLLALAELAEGVWPERARAAALGLSEGTEDDAHSVMLLYDIRELFIGKPRPPKCFETPDNGMQITTEDMRAHLVDVEDRPWGECNRGKAITKNWIARRLSDYHITSHGVNPPGGTRGVSGYLLRDFADAFERFLAPKADLDPSTQTSATPQVAPDVAFSDFQNSAAQNPAEFSNSWKPAPDKGCGDAELSQGVKPNGDGHGVDEDPPRSHCAAEEAEPTFWSWLLTYPGGSTRQVNCITGWATREQVLKRYPGAADAVPLAAPSHEDDGPHIVEGSL